MKKMLAVFWQPWLILAGLSLLPLVSLLAPGLPVTHDGQDHVARIANFYQSLSEGNVVPRWAANLNWGYGHPILMFLYPLPSYIASLFHVLGFPFVESVKLVFAVSFVASAVAMYLWISRSYGRRAGFLAGLLYAFAPYRFVDMHVRGAIGEHVAFVFPPLVMWGMLSASRQTGRRGILRYGLLTGTFLGLLILSHNAISLMFLPVFGLYALYLFCTVARRHPLRFAGALVAGAVIAFGLSAFFWVPALLEGKYTLRDIVTRGEFSARMVPWSWFVYSPWNYGQGNDLTKSLGLVQWAGIIAATVLAVTKRKTRQGLVLAGWLTVLLASLFIMTGASSFIWQRVILLQNFQFPWRFLSVSVFAAAAAGGIALRDALAYVARTLGKRFPARSSWIPDLLLAALVLVVLAGTYVMWRPKANAVRPESFYTSVYPSTTDTGESSPIWSVRFMEHFPAAPMEIAAGSVTITPGRRTTTEHRYRVEAREPSRLVENTLFFPGWKVYVDGLQAGLQYQDPAYRGLMTFRVDPGVHDIIVRFGETKLRMLSDLVSLATFGLMGLSFVLLSVWKKRRT